MKLFSYHIFYFPFKWEINLQKGQSFANRFDLKHLRAREDSSWKNIPYPKTDQYAAELFNEKNYFYDFVHPVLYDVGEDNQIMLHFERQEAYISDLKYNIKVIANKTSLYELTLKSIGLNFYSTGTGIISFYIENNQADDFEDILRINQFGRRILPPFLTLDNGITGTKSTELADYISITGLKGNHDRYFENFEAYTPNDSWKPARFIESLIDDFSESLIIKPVTDDRMHVTCWFGNDKLSKIIKEATGGFPENFKKDWYRFIFVDGGDTPTCKNKNMADELIAGSTYTRWQNDGNLNGVTRYSHTYLTNKTPPDFLITHFRTMYARMVELSLVQKASILKFSEEVTRLSQLKKKKNLDLTTEINELYREYIRFVNQVYFREVTAQDQGIELYNMLQEKMRIQDQVKDLDSEIGELHQYALLVEGREQNKNLELLTIIGALFIIPTFIVGFYGMNIIDIGNTDLKLEKGMLPYMVLGMAVLPLMVFGYIKIKKKKYNYIKHLLLIAVIAALISVLILPFFII